MARILNKITGKVIANNNRDKQELHCHECDNYVQFPIDLSLNGNHVLNCPNCGHEHCRVVEKGRITDVRWDSRNGTTYKIPLYAVVTTGYSTASTATITLTSYSTGWGVGSST